MACCLRDMFDITGLLLRVKLWGCDYPYLGVVSLFALVRACFNWFWRGGVAL